jgi:hypothetical protein
MSAGDLAPELSELKVSQRTVTHSRNRLLDIAGLRQAHCTGRVLGT